MSDFERLNIILAARDQAFKAAMDRNAARIERFARRAQKDLSKTSKSFDLMGTAAKRVGPILVALSASAVVSRLKSTISALDGIGKTADKIGITTDALQELRAVAESAGVSQDKLDQSLVIFSKTLGEASMGLGEGRTALKTLGLEADKLAAGGADKALAAVADAMAGVTDPAQRAALAMKLFGESGVSLVNLLREGSRGMAGMRAEARELGIVIDEKLVRSAEGAQTKLDLMGRVISAQLNSALISLAPFLVGTATVVADFARGLASIIEWLREVADSVSDLQVATENIVTAMGDEIRQSQLLEATLGRGVNISVEMARVKLDEAKARHENVRAIISEARAAALGSDEFGGLTGDIADAQNALNAIGFAATDTAAPGRADAFEAAQLRLVGLLARRGELLKTNAELQAQFDRSGANIATLEAGLAGARGGVVDIAGTYVDPIENSPKAEITRTGTAAAGAVPGLSDYEAILKRVGAAMAQGHRLGAGFAAEVQAIEAQFKSGQITAEEYAAALDTIGAKYDALESTAKTMEAATEDMFAAIVTGSKSAGDALADLLSQWAAMAAKAAFSGMFGGMFDGVAAIFTPGASFAGGGYTGNAPRSGGVDGMGGFPAILHPQESVIDHARGQAMPGGGARDLSINVTVNGARGNSEITEMVRQGVRQGIGEFDRAVLPRRVNQISRDPRKVS